MGCADMALCKFPTDDVSLCSPYDAKRLWRSRITSGYPGCHASCYFFRSGLLGRNSYPAYRLFSSLKVGFDRRLHRVVFHSQGTLRHPP